MNELLQSVKSDLLDRRMLPILLALGLALAGAVAFVVLGGSSAKPVAAATVAPVVAPKGPTLPVTEAPSNPNAAVAETTEGARYRHREGTHNPFKPLPSPKVKTSTTTTTTASASSGAKSGTPASSGATGGGTTTTPAQPVPSKPKPKAKPKPAYIVKLEFGPQSVPPAEPLQLPQLELRARKALPSSQDPRLIFTGVHGSPFMALFTLGREAILKGQGVCLPSTSQCESIELAPGKSEQLEYLEPTGQTVLYELKVVSIARPEGGATTSSVHHRHHRHHRHG